MKLIKWLFRLLLAGLFLAVTLAGMLAIYSLSAENGSVSSTRSENVTEWIAQEVNEHIQTEKEIEIVEKFKALVVRYSPYEGWEANVRKLAHFSLYFVLGALVWLILSALGAKPGLKWFLAVLAAFAFACTDEYHQLAVDGRTMSWLDVGIDTFGAFCSVTILTLFHKLLHWIGH
jgi:VanZ family protein